MVRIPGTMSLPSLSQLMVGKGFPRPAQFSSNFEPSRTFLILVPSASIITLSCQTGEDAKNGKFVTINIEVHTKTNVASSSRCHLAGSRARILYGHVKWR